MITTLMVVCSLPIARNFAASLQVQFLPIVGNWVVIALLPPTVAVVQMQQN